MKKRGIAAAALTVGIALAMMAGGSGRSAAAEGRGKPESTKLAVALAVPALSYLPVWVADQKGFLKDEGITDVKVAIFRGDADVLQALTGGTVDLDVSSLTGLVTSINAGQKFKAVWAGFNQPMMEWYADPKYTSIDKTKGARFAVTKYGALTDFLTRYVLRKAGIDPDKDVKILQLGGSNQSIPAMEAGQVDVTILSVPANYVAAEKGFVKLLSQRDVTGPDWPLHVVFGKEDYIATHPNTIKAFLRANARAIDWISANPDEAAQIASKTSKYKVEYCRKFIDDYKDYWFSDGRLAGEGLKVFWDLAMQAGDVKEPWPNEKWLDSTFLTTQSQWRK
jgi:NitT/TauT family transport system substrate-binding protein